MKPSTNLAKIAKENPFQFFSFEEIGDLYGFGKNTMTALAAAGAPVVAKKMNPQLLFEWLEQNADKIGKIRED